MKQTSSVNRHQSQKQDNENTKGIKKGCQQKCRVLRKELENVKKKEPRKIIKLIYQDKNWTNDNE